MSMYDEKIDTLYKAQDCLKAFINYYECDRHCEKPNTVCCCFKECMNPNKNKFSETEVLQGIKFVKKYLEKLHNDTKY